MLNQLKQHNAARKPLSSPELCIRLDVNILKRKETPVIAGRGG